MSERREEPARISPEPGLLDRLRPRSVRAKIVALLMVPVVSLMVLWGLAAVSAVQSAWNQRQIEQLDAHLTGPVSDLVAGLQAERAAAASYLAGTGDLPALQQRHAQTSTALATLQDGITQVTADLTGRAPELNRRLADVLAEVPRLGDGQDALTARQADWRATFDAFSAAIDKAFAAQVALADVRGIAAARAVPSLGRVGDMLARQDAAAQAAAAGRSTADIHRTFTDAVGGQRVLTAGLLSELPPAQLAAFDDVVTGDSARKLADLQNAAQTDTSGRALATAVTSGQWAAAVNQVTRDLAAVRSGAVTSASAEADDAGTAALTESAITVLLGLAAVLVALLISVQIGRGLVIELVGLRDSALELANRRLPRAMRRLRAGEKIDVDADVPVVPPGEGEIGQVGAALNAVQRAALTAAAERAELLTGVSGVFVTLARRSQSLVHRQLSLLDTMERRTEEPAELEDLFRLDHLAARMRRHAEGLIIMSGAAPGRTWSKPVPLMNIVRAAVAEVEEFQRVEVHRMAEVAVQGTAVADLTHMIAELVENATAFSPPNTTVLVHGEAVGAGFVVEIEDRGLGMGAERLAEANRRIAEAHQLDLFDGEQLGFYVISRLAKRQGITVTLRRSAYGGTTAVVLLPTTLLTRADPAPAEGEVPAVRARKTPARPAPARDNGRHRPPPRPAAPPPPPEPGPPPAEPAPAPVDDDVTGGLPRRKRQAHLAPGLREASGTATREEAAPPWASPEEARATMSALQQGFTRGRNA
ncbi:sensor histidine kinase [Amycolatopsis thermophila]|uniref:histidine kinase n=1 Tax=Amycolatopsis thermophila TaxID=206084 RepID=A0ABU0EMP2_9PSEU|nr:ATP-binding protein [Amycolatopsis thermophila]MDQ0376464.1 signal transduction histidine kinase [Amycolatopsis thermophila]